MEQLHQSLAKVNFTSLGTATFLSYTVTPLQGAGSYPLSSLISTFGALSLHPRSHLGCTLARRPSHHPNATRRATGTIPRKRAGPSSNPDSATSRVVHDVIDASIDAPFSPENAARHISSPSVSSSLRAGNRFFNRQTNKMAVDRPSDPH
jgi:hypothetical protein